jgi:pyrroline-5-carboxylate reductase
MKLGFLGTGAITSAMVGGLNGHGGELHHICLSPRNAARAADLAGRLPQVRVASSNQEVVDGSEVVIVAVRPQIVQDVLAELRFRADQRVISVVSGFSVRTMNGLVAPAGSVTRAVPLPAAARRRSPTAVYPPDDLTVSLFAALGGAFAVQSESEFSVLCTATATMATYFAFADGAASWLTRHGIPAAQAREYVAQLFAGLADTAVEARRRSFPELAADHATRGGTNEQVFAHMSDHGVFETFSEALDGILRRVTAGAR